MINVNFVLIFVSHQISKRYRMMDAGLRIMDKMIYSFFVHPASRIKYPASLSLPYPIRTEEAKLF